MASLELPNPCVDKAERLPTIPTCQTALAPPRPLGERRGGGRVAAHDAKVPGWAWMQASSRPQGSHP